MSAVLKAKTHLRVPRPGGLQISYAHLKSLEFAVARIPPKIPKRWDCYWFEAQCVSRLQGLIVKVVELNVARVAKGMFGMALNVGSGWVIDFDR